MAPKVQQKNQPDPAELQNAMMKRLIQTKEWDRISAILKERLSEHGWTDDIADRAKEDAKKQNSLNFKTLLENITPHAQNSIPQGVKDEIIALLREFIEANLEK
ncbi:SAGA histone acetylase and TREX-2 complexes component [Tulasnella sp. 419]|nr:SAGA histone acetylase and TREX-2 complexes component [Tulasnella sp. 419]